MPHLSSKKLNKKLLRNLLKKLLVLIEQSHKKQSTSLVLNELLTRTEKIMLAKRLAVVMMLSLDLPQHKITDILKMSPTTVAKASLKLELGKFKGILETIKKEKLDLEKIVWNILTVGGLMPPKVGKRYWRKIKK